tara:strand:+ start:213 stop:452 length:240 start_codon:yes stop_codon:yes gene_type:complete
MSDRLVNLKGKSRSYLTKKLNEIELPETNSRDFDDDQIIDILLLEAPDLYFYEAKNLRSPKDNKFMGHTPNKRKTSRYT